MGALTPGMDSSNGRCAAQREQRRDDVAITSGRAGRGLAAHGAVSSGDACGQQYLCCRGVHAQRARTASAKLAWRQRWRWCSSV
jgi:hypothetical protein